MAPRRIPVPGRAPGRPSKIAQHVLERIQLGQDLTSSAKSAGLSVAILHRWRLDGARARATAANGGRLTALQRRLVTFVDDIEKAESEAEASRLAIIQRVAQGGAVVTKTTEKRNGAGELVERTVVTETLRPEWTAAAWWLERRRKGYARRHEITGADGEPLVPPDEQARNLADSLREFQAGVAAGAALTEDRGDA